VIFHNDLERTVAASMAFGGVGCLSANVDAGRIDVEPICGISVRLIELTGANYTLEQNSPNPFNPVTKINYALGLDGQARMELLDAQGRLVQVLFDEFHQPGRYELTLDVSNLPSGNYYYRITSGPFTQTKMMTVLK
jgi:hypothetical protein